MADQDAAAAVDDDPFGAELENAIKANEALLKGVQYEAGQRMLEAQQGSGDPPSPFELAAMKKLETSVQADKMFVQARAISRRRSRRPRP